MAKSGSESLESQIARVMEIDPDALEMLPVLLADLEELGSDTMRLIGLIEDAELDFHGEALDLGCGKGSLAIALADRGMRVVAIDGFGPFVDAARASAERRGVADRCDFRAGDLREPLSLGRTFDLVALVSVGSVWGALDATLDALRSLTRPGGLMLYEDAWVPEGVTPPRGFEATATLDGLLGVLRCRGDEILVVDTPGVEEIRRANARDLRAIESAAARFTSADPELRDRVERYIREQKRQVALMDSGRIRASTILLRRGRGRPE